MISPVNSFKVLSALDNEHSLVPLLVKDLIDNTGRSVMEYRRGGQGAQHAGRERLFEEFATTAVWIGGRKALNYAVLDPAMKHIGGLDPAVDIMLFLKNQGQTVPKWIMQNRSKYLTWNIARFLIGTLVPVGVIGWAIPTINQAITRNKLAQEKQQKQMANPFANQAYAQYQQAAKAYAQYQQAPRFGNNAMLTKMAGLINNEFWGNVAIDAGISGGRLYQARNWVDRTETGIREASIVLFLYFLGDFVKGQLKQRFDKNFNAVTCLTFNSIGWLKKQKYNATAWNADKALIAKLTPKNGFNTLAKLLNTKGRFDKNPILELARHQGLLSVRTLKNGVSQLDARKWLDVAKLQGTMLGSKQEVGLVKQLFKGLPLNTIEKSLQDRLTQTVKYKGTALVASYAISTISIAVLTPLFQHWVTKQLTGKTDFPGIQQY